VRFPPVPPSATLCQNIVSDFCDDTSPGVFERLAVQSVEINSICEMEELSEVENISLLKMMESQEKPDANALISQRVERTYFSTWLQWSLFCMCRISRQRKVPILALANNLWIGEIPDDYKA